MKKTLIVYGMLFLFAFTFALAFAMEAKASQPSGCCPYELCNNGQSVGIQGHYFEDVCEFTGSHSCDMIFICADPNP